ncbi:MAG TPA: cobaltochelatase subunit CobN [Stellaceae bacterium]|nr:cobaltochelatase subunit CobN [Stellaceae bacterium]
MHLLATQPGTISDGREPLDLAQTPGDVLVLSAADSEIACLAVAQRRLCAHDPRWPSLRLASLLRLTHNYSVDLHVDAVAVKAKLVVARVLGGRGYWPYGVERLAALARAGGPLLALLPGDDQPDAELAALSTVPPAALHRLWRYLAEGGGANAAEFLRYCASLVGRETKWREPQPLLRAGLYWPGAASADLDAIARHWRAGAPVAALVFYRALVQGANLAPVDDLVAALGARGLNPLPMFVSSLKDAQSAALIADTFARTKPEIILNATGFAVASPGRHEEGPFAGADAPVLQVVFAGGGKAEWAERTRGLDARDIAMNVALPELDGRILARAVSFKAPPQRDPLTEADLTTYEPVEDRIAFVADLARNWVRLRRTPPAERRIVLVLANYPNRDGRIGNGVGLDTPASVVVALHALAAAGYRVTDIPASGDALIARLLKGPTNAAPGRVADESFPRSDYGTWFATLPRAVQDKVNARWGAPERDPFFREGELDCGLFVIPALRCGNVTVAVQPSRGYHLDSKAAYHDPDLVPPHAYLAFYAWIADGVRAHAVVHMGKHGNLEWLPGKAVALSQECFPEAALGPLPHLYPFIVNDPGEGTQAKRRTQAVIVDHLTPPLARAESHGLHAELERLIDEYYASSLGDPRRVPVLRRQILELVRADGLDRDCGIAPGEPEPEALKKLDAYLCELKEMQIRDGLHVFGRAPEGGALAGLLVAIARLPRGAAAHEASLLRSLAADLGLAFDPLDADLAAPWEGARPDTLAAGSAWRTAGDTVERLEQLAAALLRGEHTCDPAWTRTRAVLGWIEASLRSAVAASGEAEIAGLLRGLDGRFVPPGPAGAPTRGRPDVLPTGRNFFSLDIRAVPTQAAWLLGWKSAAMLIERHAQEHGDYPRRVALSAWGTANMRTGGDDVAQALALMGARPRWEGETGRVVGFELLPASVLGRPRVDVTLRVSGFFRDAFPNLIDLVDSAARAVAALDEDEEVNPLAASFRRDRVRLEAAGVAKAEAARRAGYRVFGSKPGAYGAGLQALIDERCWETDADLAAAYLAWGSYAYGAGADGAPEGGMFRDRLSGVEAVLQNQDNREHDILDSDDYYQFEGGLAATVRHLKGAAPIVYHNDHSHPESPRIRTLEEEVGRVVRARVVNPKWIAGAMRHGYKGGFELAATVDYLFAFAATAHAVANHHFDAVYGAYVEAPEVREFLVEHNPAALAEIKARLAEAIARNLWTPRRNSVADELRR